MRKTSITRRLIASVLITELLLTLGIVSLSTYLIRRQLRQSFDAALHGRAMSIAALVRFSEDENPHLIFESSFVPPLLDREYPDRYAIFASDGHAIATSPNWSPDFSKPPKNPRTYWTAHSQSEEFRVARLDNVPVLDREGPETTANPSTITVVYAASTEEMRESAWAVAIFTCLGTLALLVSSTMVTIWAVRRGLSPLAELAASAGRVSAQRWELDAPEEARNIKELRPLTEAMDEMLANLQRAFTSQREFVGNAAHELKTPIAILKSSLQLVLQRERTTEEYRVQAEGALGDVARLESLTHSMLRLARAEQVQTAKRRQELPLVDLASTCEQSAERLRPVAESRSVSIRVQPDGAPSIHGDPEDLELIWTNLLENAVRYAPNGTDVIIRISNGGEYSRIEVCDEGPGIPESELQNVFNRFHRADASRSRATGGYGLGLAIVKTMVEAYGGTVAAQGGLATGTVISVRLPLKD